MITDSFLEAKQFFQNFLSEQGFSCDLLWVFGEDIICLPKCFLIKVPLPAENESFAETLFDIGVERNFGLCLHAFCLLDGKPCCYVQLPEDDLDAQYALMGNESVKYSVRSDLINAEPIANSLLWQKHLLTAKFSDTRFRRWTSCRFGKNSCKRFRLKIELCVGKGCRVKTKTRPTNQWT